MPWQSRPLSEDVEISLRPHLQIEVVHLWWHGDDEWLSDYLLAPQQILPWDPEYRGNALSCAFRAGTLWSPAQQNHFWYCLPCQPQWLATGGQPSSCRSHLGRSSAAPPSSTLSLPSGYCVLACEESSNSFVSKLPRDAIPKYLAYYSHWSHKANAHSPSKLLQISARSLGKSQAAAVPMSNRSQESTFLFLALRDRMPCWDEAKDLSGFQAPGLELSWKPCVRPERETPHDCTSFDCCQGQAQKHLVPGGTASDSRHDQQISDTAGSLQDLTPLLQRTKPIPAVPAQRSLHFGKSRLSRHHNEHL